MKEIIKKEYDFKDYKILHVENNDEILKVVYDFDKEFKPSLSERVIDLDAYAEKLYKNAIILAAIEDDEFIAFAALYANDRNVHVAYLAQIAVKSKSQNRKIGKALLEACIHTSKDNWMTKLKLEVLNSNIVAINFYNKNGFKFCGEASEYSMYMVKKI